MKELDLENRKDFVRYLSNNGHKYDVGFHRLSIFLRSKIHQINIMQANLQDGGYGVLPPKSCANCGSLDEYLLDEKCVYCACHCAGCDEPLSEEAINNGDERCFVCDQTGKWRVQ